MIDFLKKELISNLKGHGLLKTFGYLFINPYIFFATIS